LLLSRAYFRFSSTSQNSNQYSIFTTCQNSQPFTGCDAREEPVKEFILSYEIDYIELDEGYNEETNGMDFDLFLVKKETYFNLKSVDQLEFILNKWINDFSILQPVANISHPMF
jgi:hypothetical protein